LALAFLVRSVYSYNNVAVLAIMIVFASVAGGASIFGVLRTRAAIWLGDISYGIYLIHGLLLWAILKGVSQMTDLAGLSAYWMIGVMMVAILASVTLASMSYIWLELPIMRRTAAAGSNSRQLPRTAG
jgi:peptidoglycan/LPS O-acetylase OafA/YrhL